MHRQFILGLIIFATSGRLMLAADNWPHWRGPVGTGVAADGEYPTNFSADEGVAWKAKLPGLGASTPAVWGDQIFVTCGIDGLDGVVCYGMDGNEQWRKTFGKEREGKHAKGTGSNPSPVTDGQYVVVYYKSGTVACLDLRGNVRWDVNLQKAYGKDTLWHDLGSSPVLAGGRAIMAVVHEGPSYLVGFDLATGSEAWKAEREYENPPEADQAYTSPQVVNIDGRDVIVTWGADHLTGHDADTGELLWECGGFNPQNQGYWRVIASATVGDGVAVVPWGRGEFLTGIRIGGQGDITNTNRLWDKTKMGSDVPTPIVRDGKAYVLTNAKGDPGRIVCLDLNSGDEIWKTKVPPNRNTYYASPVLAGDKLYTTREDGIIFVGRVSDDGYELLAENDMGERVLATPVPFRNSLLIRGDEHLFLIASKSDNLTPTSKEER